MTDADEPADNDLPDDGPGEDEADDSWVPVAPWRLTPETRNAIRQMQASTQWMQPLIAQFAQVSEQRQAMLSNIAASLAPVAEAQARLRESVAPMLAQHRLWANQMAPVAEWAEQVRQSLPRIDFSGIAALVQHWRELLPPNWSEDLDTSLLDVALYEHGLPVVWVPGADILDEVLAVPSREERLAVLRTHQDQVLDDCEGVVEAATHQELAGQAPLVQAAISALRAGHPEAAQALAVAVADTLIHRFMSGRYDTLKDLVKVDLDEVVVAEFRQAVALAPIHVFLAEWYPNSGKPVPGPLSRHVTFHQAQANHLHADNALVAVMLAASLLRTFEEQIRVNEAGAA